MGAAHRPPLSTHRPEPDSLGCTVPCVLIHKLRLNAFGGTTVPATGAAVTALWIETLTTSSVNGLSRDTGQFLEQIAFVGERYGGAQERFVSIRNEAALIVSNLLPRSDNWLKAVREVEPLIQRVPDQTTLDLLFSPFVGTRQWPVWASKVLHFLRPGVFPILDSNAKKPLGLKNLVNSSHGYHQFCSKFRDAMLANPDALKSAHEADSGESPSDLKLLDKILYQIGIDMN